MTFFHLLPTISVQDIECLNSYSVLEEYPVKYKRDYVCLHCRKGFSTPLAPVKHPAKQGRTQQPTRAGGELCQQLTTSSQPSSVS